MTEKVNPSNNRPASSFKTAGAIALGGGTAGWVVDGAEPTELSQQDADIDATQLNTFSESHTSTSVDVTIDPGEAFVYGSWVCIDQSTTVTVASDTADQTIYVGWNKGTGDDVIIGLASAFNTASADTDEKIPLYSVTTDIDGVTGVTDLRVIDKTIDARVLSETASVSSNYTTDGEQLIFTDTSSGSITVTLSTKDTVDGNAITFSDRGSARADPVTIETAGASQIDGATSTELGKDYGAVVLVSDGDDWYTAEVQGNTEAETQDIIEAFLFAGDNVTITRNGSDLTIAVNDTDIVTAVDGEITEASTSISNLDSLIADIDSDSDGVVDEANVGYRIEERTDYPSNPENGRVVFRSDKT